MNKSEDIVKWYDWVIKTSGIAYPGLVKGTIFICDKGWRIWECIQRFLNSEYEKLGVKNVAFPSLIPVEEIEKEKAKLSGFIPELFLVNSSERQHEESKVFLRPTSEILFSYFFKKILDSYEKLPLLFNQWCNVYRSEKNTRIFLRSCEFYWQEAHTLHLTKECAFDYFYKFHSIYKKLLKEVLNIYILEGEKTVNERFKGAENTLALEAIMPDGQSLQVATTHYLGTNFSQMFEIRYRDNQNNLQNPYQLSAGTSTRLLGALILSHSDDNGLVLPLNLVKENIKIFVLDNSISKDSEMYKKVSESLGNIENCNFNWYFSSDSFGSIMNKEEKEGTPFVLVIGTKEVKSNSVLVKSRVHMNKDLVKLEELDSYMSTLVKEYSEILYMRSKKNTESIIVEVDNLDSVKKEVLYNKKLVLAPWFDDSENENNFSSENFGFGPRCIKERISTNSNDGKDIRCFYSGKKANSYVYFGRSY